jgi:hypothetical protein
MNSTKLGQGLDAFYQYVSDFERHAATLAMPDDQRIYMFKNALPIGMKTKLIEEESNLRTFADWRQ